MAAKNPTRDESARNVTWDDVLEECLVRFRGRFVIDTSKRSDGADLPNDDEASPGGKRKADDEQFHDEEQQLWGAVTYLRSLAPVETGAFDKEAAKHWASIRAASSAAVAFLEDYAAHAGEKDNTGGAHGLHVEALLAVVPTLERAQAALENARDRYSESAWERWFDGVHVGFLRPGEPAEAIEPRDHAALRILGGLHDSEQMALLSDAESVAAVIGRVAKKVRDARQYAQRKDGTKDP